MKSESSVTRRSFVAGVTGAAAFGLSACKGDETKKEDASGSQKKADAQKLIVFAAASLTESLTEAGELFKNANQGVDISFNFDLIEKDIKCIEYVVLHELCHIFYMNHQKDFWALVEKYMPDYKIRRKNLKSFS